MTTFEATEEFIVAIEEYQPGVEASVDAQFYSTFAKPSNIHRFIVFVDCLVGEHQVDSVKRQRLVNILTDCIYEKETLADLLYATVDESPKNSLNTEATLISRLINILVSLPELISNLFGLNCPEKFTVKRYTVRLCTVLGTVLERVHSSLTTSNLSHFNLIIGRLCLKGHSQIVWDSLLQPQCAHLLTDTKWQQIAHQILLANLNQQIASVFTEPVLKMIFLNAPCYRIVDRLLSFEYIKCISGPGNLLNRLEFLLSNKFLLIHHQSPSNGDQFLWNIFTYLCRNNQEWLSTAVSNLLDTWLNGNAFKCRPYYQHFYLCRALLIAAKIVFEDKAQERLAAAILPKFRNAVLDGAQIHLNSTQMEFRAVGLLVTFIVMKSLNSYSKLEVEASPLEETECPDNEDCIYLKELAKVDVKELFNADPVVDTQTDQKFKSKLSQKPTESRTIETRKSEKDKPTAVAPSVPLDSDDDDCADDDLHPYDLSNDVKVESDIRFVGKDLETSVAPTDPKSIQASLLIDGSRRAPIYLQDVMEGLTQSENPAWTERCIQSAEAIIRANFAQSSSSSSAPLKYGRLNAVARDFAKLLFALDNTHSVENFSEHRLNALVALCVGAPSIVAQTIGESFYAPYLSIRARLDVLTVLTTASEELSQMAALPEATSTTVVFSDRPNLLADASGAVTQFERKYFDAANSPEEEETDERGDDWRSVVASRIRANTRFTSPAYLKKNFEAKPIAASTSRFVPVSGHFFFPLLRDPSKLAELHLKVHDEDAFVLEHLFYSLGYMLQNCANYPQVMLMAKELLAFMLPFRGHELANVRQAMIMALQAVLRSTPAFYLFDDLMSSLLQLQLWLKEIALNDVNQQCMETARQTLALLFKLKANSEENVAPIESKQTPESEAQLVQTTASVDLNTTIRILKQTTLH